METRDQWYKPNLLYNIHWRPPKTQEPPKMVVKTVRFNPSVCTCGEHSCEPHYRMEKKVVWINEETTNTEDKHSESRKSFKSDQEPSENLRNKEGKIGDGKCESDNNDKQRCFEGKIGDGKCEIDDNDKQRCFEELTGNKVIPKEEVNVSDGKRTDEKRKQGGDGYLIRTGECMNSESDEESGGASFKDRAIHIIVEDVSVSGENNGIEARMENVDDKPDVESLKLDFEKNNVKYNNSLRTEDKLSNIYRCNDKADDEERCSVNSTDNSSDGGDEDVINDIYEDEEISPAFGIMSIYCRSELHHKVLESYVLD